jgi:acyl-CoA synthetase (AMP-forming)/AMP-acid ligase II
MSSSIHYSPDTRQKFSNLVEILHYRALYQPDKTAYTFLQDRDTESFSLAYQEIDRQARVIAAQLQSLGGKGGN